MSDSNDIQVPRSRRSRILRILLMLAALVVLYALLGFFVVPRVARWAIQTKGSEALHRQVTVGEVTFNPFTLEATVRSLAIRDRDGAPLFSFAQMRARLGVSGVFRRAWHLRELAIVQPQFQLRFTRDGRLSFADLLEKESDGKPTRLILDLFDIRNGRLDYVDESAAPRIAQSFGPLNAAIRDVVTIPGERGDHALTIGFDRKSTIRVTGKQTMEPLELAGAIELRNLDLQVFASRWLADLPLLVRRGAADLTVDYRVQSTPAGIDFRLANGVVTATDVALGSRSATVELFAAPQLELRGVELAVPARTAAIESLRIVAPRAAVVWNEQGQFNWSMPPAATPQQNAAAHPWTFTLAKASMENGTLQYDDRQPAAPVRFDLTGLALGATGITNDPAKPVPLTASAAAPGGGTIALRGSLVPSPFALDVQASLAAIDLVTLRPYIAVPGLTLASGSLGFDGRMLFTSTQPYFLEGDGSVSGVELRDPSDARLLACRKAMFRSARFDGAASRNRIRSIDLDGFYANVAIDKQSNLNLGTIGESGQPATGDSAKSSLAIGTINLTASTIDYRDDSLALPFATAIDNVKGRITDYSSTALAAGTIRLDGTVAEAGAMTAEGTMRMADPFAGTDLTVRFRNVPMPTLTPYTAEFAGYAIEKGALDLDVHYRITDRKLLGDNRVVASDLTLGRKVGGSKAGFAVRLAVALLKDREGKINLDVPIEGTIDSPEFNYRAVMWQAVKTILWNAVKAPFRALGNAMGIGGGDDLQMVSFNAGDAAVAPPEQEKLKKIAAELAARPGIDLAIEGRYDPKLDRPALQFTKLEALIASKREAADDASLDQILEAAYAEAFTAEKLEEERAKFAKPPEAPKPEPERKLFRRKAPAPLPVPVVTDPGAFYDALRAQLVAAQPVSEDELTALARARSEAIVAVLTSEGLLPPDRVRAGSPVSAQPKDGALRVNAEMKMAARGASPDETDD